MNIFSMLTIALGLISPSFVLAEELITSFITEGEEVDALTPGFHMFALDLRSEYEISCIKKGELLVLHEAGTDYLLAQWKPENFSNVDDPEQTQADLDQIMVKHLNFMPHWTVVGRIECDNIVEEMLAEWGLLDPASELLRLRHIDGFADWLAVLMDAEVPDSTGELLASDQGDQIEDAKL